MFDVLKNLCQNREMKNPRNKKMETHRRIIESACKVFRKKGYSGAGIDGIMESAQLTAGGFYAHFPSKEHLFSEMISTSLHKSEKWLFEDLGSYSGVKWLKKVLEQYLSKSHRDSITGGCLIPTIISDLPRFKTLASHSFESEIKKIAEGMAEKMPRSAQDDSFAEALAVLALCVGGLSLARAVKDPQLSEQILKACQKGVPIPKTK